MLIKLFQMYFEISYGLGLAFTFFQLHNTACFADKFFENLLEVHIIDRDYCKMHILNFNLHQFISFLNSHCFTIEIIRFK